MNVSPEVRHLAATYGPVVSSTVLEAAGFSEWHRRRSRERGFLVPLGRGLYRIPSAEESLPPWEVRRRRHNSLARAVVATLPGVYLTGPSAALFRGLPLLEIPEQLHISRQPRLRTRSKHLRISRPWIKAPELVGDVPCASSAAAVVEIAAGNLPSALIPGDAAQGRGELSDLTEMIHRWGARSGCVRVKLLPDLIDGRSESPLETQARWNFHVLGVPVTPQFTVRDSSGEFVAKTDFRVEGHNLLVEVDGRVKYAASPALYREKQRQEQIEQLGWGVLRFDNRDIQDEHRFQTRLFAAMKRW